MKYLIWATALTLAACGNTGQTDNPARAAVQSVLGRVTGQEPKPPAINAAALINADPGESLVVRIVNRDVVAALRLTAINGDRVTWESPGEVSMTFENGILVATRGLTEDLMGADIAGVRAALDIGGGTAIRRHSYLSSEDQITVATMTCIIAPDGTEDVITRGGTVLAVKYREDCTGPRLVFSNSYWFNGSQLVQTRQLASVAMGYIQSNPF
jgi:hypothetical protein